jgi:hypothetical protein
MRRSQVFSDLGRSEEFAALLKQELSYCWVFCQADSTVVGICGVAGLPQTLQEVSANRPVRLIMRHSFWVNRFQDRKSCFRSVRFRDRGGVSGSRAQRRGYADQLLIEACDRRPLSSPGARALRVYRLNGSFELESADLAALESLGQMVFRIFYQRKGP